MDPSCRCHTCRRLHHPTGATRQMVRVSHGVQDVFWVPTDVAMIREWVAITECNSNLQSVSMAMSDSVHTG